jgi:hypothetical protein
MASKGQQKGDGPSALAKSSENQLVPINEDEWVESMIHRARSASQKVLDAIDNSIDDIPPENLAAVLDKTVNVAERMAQRNQANLNVNVGIKLDGDDLSHADLVGIISGLSPSDNLQETKRVNEIQSQYDNENESQQEATNKQWDAKDSQVIDIEPEAKDGSLDQSVGNAKSIGEGTS